jgi:large subunit ribosomal protein L18
MSVKHGTRWRRKMRVRRTISGTASRPRLSVFRSNLHMYAQLIDDRSGTTLAAASTRSPQCTGQLAGVGRKEAAKIVGKAIADLAKAKGIDRVIFDRSGYKYHGRVRALAEGAREGGLKF